MNIWYFWVLRSEGSCSKFLILLFETSLLIESRTDLQVVRLIWPIWTRDSHVALLAQFQFCKLCKRFNSYSIKALIKTHWQWQKPKPQNSVISRSVNSGNIYHVTSSILQKCDSGSIFSQHVKVSLKYLISDITDMYRFLYHVTRLSCENVEFKYYS